MMTPQALSELSALLDEALDLEGPARMAWLASLERRDPTRGRRLRDLLDRSGLWRTDELLQRPNAFAPEPLRDFAAGEQVGPYRLMRPLGAGGMGEVWMAERADGALHRQVALKLPTLGGRRAAWMQRFARERDILASLEHPNIARLYDAGVAEDGQPYLALEFIQGLPIDAWCAERGLALPARLALLVQVARAVAFAHGRLVLHRDIKPSNILVTDDGQVRLLDFGIAKLLQDDTAVSTDLTRLAGRAMTPNYASPEQLRGLPLGTASDVYSLGVVAYEVLAGAPPYRLKRGTAVELEEAVLAVDAPAASTVAADARVKRALRGDLDAILNKALKKEAVERYPSVEALAADFERALAGEAVSARPDSVWYRAHRFVRRHGAALGVVVAASVVVLVGGALTFVQADRAQRSVERERLVRLFVAELFRFGVGPGASGGGGVSDANASLAERGLGLIEERFAGQLELQVELFGVVGRMYADMGALPVAARYLERQLDRVRQLGAGGAAEVRALLALAEVQQEAGRLDAARPHAQRALELARTDRALAGAALHLLAGDRAARGDGAAARELGQRALHLLEEASAGPSALKAHVRHLLAAVADIPEEQRSRHYDAAIAEARQAEGALSRTAATLSINRVARLIGSGRFPEARQRMALELDVFARRGGADAIWGATWGASLWFLLFEAGAASGEEALRAARAARAVIDRHASIVPAYFAKTSDFNEGRILLELGRLDEAAEKLASIEWLRRDAENVFDRRRMLRIEGALMMERGQHDAAEAVWVEVLRIRKAANLTTRPYGAYDHARLAHNRLMQGELARAREALDAAPAFPPDPDHATRARLTAELLSWERARLMLLEGRPEAAAQIIGRLARYDDGAERLSTAALDAEIRCAARRHGEGLTAWRAVIEARAARVDWRDPLLARHRAVAGLCALEAGNRAEATRLLALARSALDAQPGVSGYFRSALRKLEARLKPS